MNFDCQIIEPELAASFKEKHPGAQVVPTRWVDINKAQQGEQEQIKSRLVVRGDLEQSAQRGEVRTDSPTASHLMLSLLLTFACCFELTLHAGDITAAFLQGLGLARTLVMALPGVKPGPISFGCTKASVWDQRRTSWFLAFSPQDHVEVFVQEHST